MIASTWVISSKKRARIYISGEKTQKAEGQKGLHRKDDPVHNPIRCLELRTSFLPCWTHSSYFCIFLSKNIVPFLTFTLEWYKCRAIFFNFGVFSRGYVFINGGCVYQLLDFPICSSGYIYSRGYIHFYIKAFCKKKWVIVFGQNFAIPIIVRT